MCITRSTCQPTVCINEGAFFAPGSFRTRFRYTLRALRRSLCSEDFWHASPPYLLWLDGADVGLFSCCLRHGRGLNGKAKLKSSAWVEHTNRDYASLFTTFVDRQPERV